MSGLRGRSAVTADHRSVVPRLPGIPWWAATLVAATVVAIGFAYDAGTGNQALGNVFAACYVLGCVVAVLAVRQSGVFTAVIQPPLILFVAVPLAYFVFHGSTATGIKDILINCGYPLIERFPLMVVTSAIVLLIGVIRWYLGAAARRGIRKATEPDPVSEVPSERRATAAETPAAAEAAAPRRARRSTSQRTSRTPDPVGEDAVVDEAPRRSRRSAAAASPAASAGAAIGSTRPRRPRLPDTETVQAPSSRPRRRDTPPVEPRRRARASDAEPGDTREPRQPREPRGPRERRPLPPLERRSSADRAERADRPQRQPFEQRAARSERPQRRPRATDYESYDAYEPYEAPSTPPPSRPSGTHHPVSRVRYRGSDEGEQRTEHRTRPRSARHSAPEAWDYDD